MNKCQKIIGAALCSLIFHTPLYAMEQLQQKMQKVQKLQQKMQKLQQKMQKLQYGIKQLQPPTQPSQQQIDTHRRDFLKASTTPAYQQLADLFPTATSLDEILPMLAGFTNPGTITGAINTAALPGSPASSGDPLTDIQTVTAAINPGSPDLGTAVSSAVTLTGSAFLTPPVGHTTLIGDLTADLTAIGPDTSIGGAITSILTQMGLNPSSGVISKDLTTLFGATGPGGNAAIFVYIGVANLPTHPDSSNIILGDLEITKNAISTSFLITNLGAAITASLNTIGTVYLNPSVPSSNVINTDLAATVSTINSTNGLTLGGAIASVLTQLGTVNLSPPIASTGVIYNDIPVVINLINPTSLTLGAAVAFLQNALQPGATNLIGSVTAINNILGPQPLVTANTYNWVSAVLGRLNDITGKGITNMAASNQVFTSIANWITM